MSDERNPERPKGIPLRLQMRQRYWIREAERKEAEEKRWKPAQGKSDDDG